MIIIDEKEKNSLPYSNYEQRRKRVKRIKRIIIGITIALLLLPTVLSVIVLMKLNSMNNRIADLERKVAGMPTAIVTEVPTKADASKEDKTQTPQSSTPQADEAQASAASDKQKPAKETIKKSAVPQEIKTVYLTFDDGPSSNTERILAILKKHNIKATFFVQGKDTEEARTLYKKIVAQGHTLAMHSYSHDASIVYASEQSFIEDFNKISDYLFEVTGIRPKYYRFPGGSSTKQTDIDISVYIKYLQSQGIKYFDWNAQNSDAQKTVLSADELVNNAMDGINRHDVSIVLMHDANSRDNTVESLDGLITKLEQMNAKILPIDDNTPQIVHVSVKDE